MTRHFLLPRRAAGALFAMAAVLVFTCGPSAQKPGKKPVLAVSLYPLSDIAAAVAGPDAEVIYAIPAGANPHSYEPSPSSVRDLQRATIFIGVMRPFDGWIEKFLSRGAARHYLKDTPRSAHGHHDESDPANNPHIWLSVGGARKIAARICEYLSAADRPNAAAYRRRLDEYGRRLEDLDGAIRRRMAASSGRAFVQWHPSWDFFAADYGLRVAATVEKGEGAGPSVGDFRDLVKKARAEKVRVIVLDLNARNATAEALAREIGGEIVRLDGIGGPSDPASAAYIGLMRANAERLAAALEKSGR